MIESPIKTKRIKPNDPTECPFCFKDAIGEGHYRCWCLIQKTTLCCRFKFPKIPKEFPQHCPLREQQFVVEKIQ